MTNPQTPRHIEVRDEHDRTAAVAEVAADQGPEGTVRASLYAKSEYVRPGDRTSLVDAVMDSPEVRTNETLEAAVPRGDIETVERLKQRTDNPVLRAAGASTLLDASIPRYAEPPAEGELQLVEDLGLDLGQVVGDLGLVRAQVPVGQDELVVAELGVLPDLVD